MTPAERHARLQAILDRHDELARNLRRSDDAVRDAETTLDHASHAVRHASQAHREAIDEAIDGMLAANRELAALYAERDEDPRV